MNIEIKKMTLSDLNDLSEILIANFDDFWTIDTLKSELESPYSTFFIARNQTEILGFIGFKTVMDDVDIMNIVVRNDIRNQGIGSKLLEYVINFISCSSNISKINLEVAEDNFCAISLYEKFDFKRISTRKNYYKNKTAIIMQKIIK